MSPALPASRGLLSVVAGNTPEGRGAAVDAVCRSSPDAVVLSVLVHQRGGGYPFVQRLVTGPHADLQGLSRVVTGDPVVILAQDLLAIRRVKGRPHVVLALPRELDVLPFLVELWRPRTGLLPALDEALLDDAELALGPSGWAEIPDPLLSDP